MRRLPLGAILAMSVGGCSFALDGYAGPDDTATDAMTQPDVIEPPHEDAEAIDAAPPGLDAGDAEAAAPKPIAFVQTTASQTEVSGSTSFSLGYPMPVGEHNTLIAALYVGPNSQLTSVTDTLGNTFEILCNQQVDAYGINVYLAAAYDINGGALDTVTIHMTGSTTTNLLLHEYANVAPGSGCTHAIGTAATPDGIVSPPLTLTVPNEMIFAYAVSSIVAPGTSFTARSMYDGDLTEDRIANDPGMASAIATVKSGGPAWGIVAADFKPK